MADSDSSTVDFAAAAAKFTKASKRVYTIHVDAHRLADNLESAEVALSTFREQVTSSVAGQMRAPHEPDALAERVIEVLAADLQYIALMGAVQDVHTGIVKNDADLERARDERVLAMRRMDYVVASLAVGEEHRGDD